MPWTQQAHVKPPTFTGDALGWLKEESEAAAEARKASIGLHPEGAGQGGEQNTELDATMRTLSPRMMLAWFLEDHKSCDPYSLK